MHTVRSVLKILTLLRKYLVVEDLKFLVGRNFSQRPKIKSLLADFFFTDKVTSKIILTRAVHRKRIFFRPFRHKRDNVYVFRHDGETSYYERSWRFGENLELQQWTLLEYS